MAVKQVLQLIIIPHRPAVPAEIDADLAPTFAILRKADGLKGLWRGKKFEERYTQVALLLWESHDASYNFFISPAYGEIHKAIQPAMNGRTIDWTTHAPLNQSALSSMDHLESILSSPALEVALTKVVEGGVSGYYSQFNKVVTGILDEEPGCDGYWISPVVESPQDQLLLINWKSVDAHHEVFEKKPGFRACIDALNEYYRIFVVPWHITEIYKVDIP